MSSLCLRAPDSSLSCNRSGDERWNPMTFVCAAGCFFVPEAWWSQRGDWPNGVFARSLFAPAPEPFHLLEPISEDWRVLSPDSFLIKAGFEAPEMSSQRAEILLLDWLARSCPPDSLICAQGLELFSIAPNHDPVGQLLLESGHWARAQERMIQEALEALVFSDRNEDGRL